jgi:sugar (pentulose or hexulose) kinase
MNVIAILDVGKTNKKLLLFDEQYRIVWERSVAFDSTTDEDGESCEDLRQLTSWVSESLAMASALADIRIRAVNFSAYGASWVHLGSDGQPVAPLYNYLKAYPEALRKKFYKAYGGEVTFSMLTASPVLGSLNSGMQLYRIKHQLPELYARIHCSLHLPQYLSYLLTGKPFSEITSIGCHTNLWNFAQQHYHEWVYREGIIDKLAPIVPSTSVQPLGVGKATAIAGGGARSIASGRAAEIVAGVGLHDSSASIIPYLESFREPFVLISTGTWCITMNPFNDEPLTVAELQQDCLCYMSYLGRPVKSARLFAGHDHEQQVKRLADHFHVAPAFAATVVFDPVCVADLREREEQAARPQSASAGAAGGDSKARVRRAATAGGKAGATNRSAKVTTALEASVFGKRELAAFDSFGQAYHRLMMDIMEQQVASTRLVLHDTGVRRIFVDGGFGRNQVYMHLLAAAFPDMEVFAASIPQATAMGAALAIHSAWNKRILPGDIIDLKYYK